jgi:hypothetical protein
LDGPAFEKLLLEALADLSPTIGARGSVYRVSANSGAKRAAITWPYPLGEVFLDLTEHNEVVFSESVEYYEGEGFVEQVEDIAHVLRNFFHNETRVVVVGSLLKRRELQFRAGSGWVSVFASASET